MYTKVGPADGGGWLLYAKNITDLMQDAIVHHIGHKSPDAVLNIETHLYHVLLFADTCQYSLDVGKELWLNQARWSRLIREYVNKEHLDRFISQCREIITGESRQGATANMMFRDPDRHAKKHRWGGCLMSATFRGSPGDDRKPVLTLFSRTTYMGYMALLDAAIAHVLAVEISDGKPEEIAFHWHITSQQLHCFKTLPYIYSNHRLLAMLKDALKHRDRKGKEIKKTGLTPTLFYLMKWYSKVLDAYKEHGVNMLNHEKYGPFKRIKRRWLEHMGYSEKNLPKSLSVNDLTFDKAE